MYIICFDCNAFISHYLRNHYVVTNTSRLPDSSSRQCTHSIPCNVSESKFVRRMLFKTKKIFTTLFCLFHLSTRKWSQTCWVWLWTMRTSLLCATPLRRRSLPISKKKIRRTFWRKYLGGNRIPNVGFWGWSWGWPGCRGDAGDGEDLNFCKHQLGVKFDISKRWTWT